MKQLQTFLLTLLLLSISPAFAHGKDDPAKPRPYDASKVEETDFGREGDPKKVSKTIKVDMADSMRFTPDHVSIQRGQTIKFIIHNRGQQLHEMVLGTPDAIKEHAALMKKFPGMEHDAANMAHVQPKASGEIIWQFNKAGEFQFACLLPGHYEAGMVGKVIVK